MATRRERFAASEEPSRFGGGEGRGRGQRERGGGRGEEGGGEGRRVRGC